MVGIDIVDVSRIASAAKRHGDRFLKRVFTDGELEHVDGMKRKYESLAGRFAAKEAFMKAMGRRLSFRDIEVRSRDSGKPFIVFAGKRYDGLSISHERTYAVSVVVIERPGNIPKEVP